MKTVVVTPYSAKSRRTKSETDSCYFPGCRKDANCNCEICLASINATLDLMPMSIQKSSLTKLSFSSSSSSSSSKSMAEVETTSIPFKRSILSTSTMGTRQISKTPPLKSTAKSSNLFEKKKTEEEVNKKKRKKRRLGIGIGFDFWRLVVGLSVIFAVDSGFSWMVSGLFRPLLSAEMVRNVGEESWVVSDLNEKLGFLQKHLEEIVDVGKVWNCSSVDSSWELNQGGLLLNSRCTLYKSTSEEVSIWGWPLQTAGVLVARFSSRSLTTLSGRVTEWPNGKMGFTIHEANSSWVLGRLKSSAVQMDPNTWILEYTQNSMLENTRLSSAALEFLKLRMLRVVEEVKQQVFLLVDIAYQYTLRDEENFKHPT